MSTISLKLNNSLQNINYLIYCPETRHCLVVDPLDVDLILQTAQAEDLKITQIVNTHEHGDHTGGNLELKKVTNAKVLAHHGAKNLIPGFDEGLSAGNIISIGKTVTLTVMDTPGHTMHHVCLHDKQDPAIYTGDTLFNCGCGNCHNRGDPEVMFNTFEAQLQHLPDNTKIYPGHDYIKNNLEFAKSFETNLELIADVEQKANKKDLYISDLAEDKTINPFFQLENSELIATIREKINLPPKPTRKEVFLALRKLRNQW